MTGDAMPRATVILTTFNHEQWIGQAIDSVLRQATAFSVEFIVREDFSSDRTRDIVLAYAHQYPGRISLELSEANAYSRAAWLQSIANARAPYVALLDGDDFWTDDRKLQRQVEFLEEHPECSMCVHNAKVVYEGTEQPSYNYVKPGRKPFSSILDILRNNFIPTCGAMLVKRSLIPLPPWLMTAKWDDWSLYIAAALHGPIGYVDEIMGVYRRHPGGAWSGLTRAQQVAGLIEFLEQMNVNLVFAHEDLIEQRIGELKASLVEPDPR
jgi:glycosyltransferase involved in cell wall biosynthesis